MHTVMETDAFARAANALLTDEEHLWITNAISANPTIGDVIPGTGGARKLRFAGRGKGKSGGYRVITFYAAEDVPVFLLDIFSKGQKMNLSKAERNELKGFLATLAEEWRASARAKVASLGRRATR
jgi:hypothetical protein